MPPPKPSFQSQFAALLVLADAAACACALLGAYAVRHWFPVLFHSNLGQPIVIYTRALPWAEALWLLTFYSGGLYEVRRFISHFAELSASCRAASLATLLIAAASFLSKVSYSRAMLLMFWVFALIITCIIRGALGAFRHHALTKGGMATRTLVIGCGDLGRVAGRRMMAHGALGYDPIGYIAIGESPSVVEGLPVLGRLADLPRVVAEQRIDEVLVARPSIPTRDLMAAIQSCEGLPVEFHLIAGPLEVLTANAEFSGLADLPVVELKERRFPLWKRAAKRAADLIAVLITLALTAVPMLVIAGLIRRQTGENALFRQRRVGYRGREFTMLKFRTMHGSADPYAPSPESPGDERITPIGRWLRRFSLDELPQLINVLRGEMSIVGPRPEMPFLVARYEPWQRRRLDAKPGITGLWQILGRKDLPLVENIEYDFYYIKNQSLLLDMTILLKTLPVVLGGKGAY